MIGCPIDHNHNTRTETVQKMTGMLTGLAAAQKSAEEAKSRQVDFSDGSLSYFGWKDGDIKILRFLSNDDIITADPAQGGGLHDFIICNDGKTRSFLINPAVGDLVAQYAQPELGLGMKLDYKSKQPVDRKPVNRTIGIAVERELVAREGGGGFDIQDKIEEVEIDGVKYPARVFGLVTQSFSNFWGSLLSFSDMYDGICDRDYRIKRDGGGVDTKYHIAALDKLPELEDVKVVQETYGYGKAWDKESPERFLYCPQTLPQWADWFAGEDRVKKFLLPANGATVAPTTAAPATPAGLSSYAKPDEAQATPAPVVTPGNTDLTSLRAKLMPPKPAAAAAQ